jgi:eukaryotic-like serine/threonine-protein kinase
MSTRTSKHFGRYEILSELGRGAMGVVYKARDPKINRIVAVKTISLAGQPEEDEREYRERFIREAEAAGRVSHPGIVTIFDVGEEPKTRAPYIVMEFVSGESLDKLLSKDDRKLPVEKALQLALELAEALDCAHRQGVVHRDLKPANILMTEDGHAKIADFGVAKLNLSNQTLVGRALGTPAYMSPEQLNGDAVDGRSDLFSLGVILYTVLTGHRPFQGNSAVTISFKVVNREPIPASLLDTELPEGLDHIIEKAMAKDPAERYQRGAEMVLDIQNLQEARKQKGKARPTALSTGGSAVPTATAKPRAPALGQMALGQLTSKPPVPALASGQPAVGQARTGAPKSPPGPYALPLSADARDKLRKLSFAAVVLLTGLFILGLWVISFGPQGVRPRAAEPLRPAASVVPVKTPAPQPAPPASPTASAKAVIKTSAATVAENLAKPIKPHRTDSPPVKVARATLPPASPVLLPVAAPVVTPATLEIEVDHKFAEAHLSIWVDDKLTFTRALEGTDKKRLGVFHHVQGHELHAMQVPPGKHRLRVRVTSGEDAPAVTAKAAGVTTAAPTEVTTRVPTGVPTYNQSAFVDGEFVSGRESVLQITFKHGEINLNLQ